MAEKLDEKEQQALIALFQAFLQLPNAEQLRLHFWADTGGGLIDASGKTVSDEKIVLHWHDLQEGVEAMQWYAEQQKEQANGRAMPIQQ